MIKALGFGIIIKNKEGNEEFIDSSLQIIKKQ